jgi:Derlin-2/3
MAAANPGPREIYEAIKPVTRVWLTAAVLVMLGAKFGFVYPSSIGFVPELVLRRFEVWRLVTTFFFIGMPSFNTLFRLYNLYRFGNQLESSPFAGGLGAHEGNVADYAFQLGFVSVFALLLGAALGSAFLGPSLLASVIYLWSKRFPTQRVGILFFQMDGLWFPWAMVAISLALGDDPTPELMGIAAAHVFYFLREEVPKLNTGPGSVGATLGFLSALTVTPGFVYRAFGADSTEFPPGQQRIVEQQRAFRAGGAMGGIGRVATGAGAGFGGGGGGGAGRPVWPGQGNVLGSAPVAPRAATVPSPDAAAAARAAALAAADARAAAAARRGVAGGHDD